MKNEDDPETCFRRGYQQGAYKTYVALAPYVPSKALKFVEDWLAKIAAWRLRGECGQDGGRANSSPPPPLTPGGKRPFKSPKKLKSEEDPDDAA